VGRPPAEGLPPGPSAGYEALRARFRAGLPERWREIERAPDPAARAAALHRLAGAAGLYGYDALGEAARAAERVAAEAAGPALDRALAELERLLRQAAA
jgi:HPt (histidine-containing phosphotransfer) domain-containing protein